MTKEQLDAIRARVEAAKSWRPFTGSVDDIIFGQHALKDVPALLAEVERLRAWQVAVADGMGYLNHAEGQGGYEVADPDTILGAWKDQEREIDRLTVEVEGLRKRLGDISEVSSARLAEAFTDGTLVAGDAMREQIQKAFARGAAAMREAARNAVRDCWLDVPERVIRALPGPEDTE